MSNTVVGGIYAQIIDRIIAEAQNDFEEAGLEQETLQELKQKWQTNISDMHIAHCPWDPSPPPQQVSNPPTLPSNVKAEGYKPEAYKGEYKQQDYKPEANGVPSHFQQQGRNGTPSEPHIKQEMKHEAMPPAYQQHQGSLNSIHVAHQRSQQLLHQQFGSQANASIQAMQHQQQQRPGIALPHQQQQQHQQYQQQHQQQQQYQQRPTHIQLPGQGQRPPQQQPPHAQQPSNLGAAQTDGAGDAQIEWTAMLAERRGRTDEDRIAADDMFKAYLEQSAAESCNGIMMPLSEHPSMNRNSNRKNKASSQMPAFTITGPSSAPKPILQFDGGDDDEDVKLKLEADEDAINSDLDDSEDELENPDADDQEGGNAGETILCTYDKVQRVKNKWKCVLKDGILTTGGKEYVFHKATGEFEW